MKTIATLFKRLSPNADEPKAQTLANPSQVLRVHKEDISGTLEITNLDDEESTPPLRVSWIRRDDIPGRMKPVWVNDEMEVL